MESKKRSIAQNKYRWSVIVKYYRDWFNLAIDKHNAESGGAVPHLSAEMTDFFIKDNVWGLIKRVRFPFGEITTELPLRTADTKTFEERMEQARAYAAMHLHLEIPLPREDIRDIEEQYADNLNR